MSGLAMAGLVHLRARWPHSASVLPLSESTSTSGTLWDCDSPWQLLSQQMCKWLKKENSRGSYMKRIAEARLHVTKLLKRIQLL